MTWRNMVVYHNLENGADLKKTKMRSGRTRYVAGNRASAPWSIHSTVSQEVFDSKTSKKIIQLARDQQEELALREELDVGEQEATR
jgi:hypothetical protein